MYSTTDAIEKIKKLLALAADQAGKPEGERAAEIAQRHMLKHALTMADLEEEEAIIESVEEVNQTLWVRELWTTIAQHCNCASVYSGGRGRKNAMKIIGFTHDVAVSRYLFHLCHREIEDATARYMAHPGRKGKTVATQFRRSAVAGLHWKLTEMRSTLYRADQQAALVLRSRLAQAQEEMDRRYQTQVVSQPKMEMSVAGWNAGYSITVNNALEG